MGKFEKIFLVLLIAIGSFLRLYRLPQTMQFLGDQGRDAIIAKNILIDHDVALVGPVTSVGNMYLGPFYYYFMVPWLALTYPSPIGPAIGVAFIGILTLFLLYRWAKEMFGHTVASIGSLLYATNTVVIANVRFSWNPNIAPFFGLTIFYLLYKLAKERKYHLSTYILILFGLLIQLHYISLLFAPTIALTFLYVVWKVPTGRVKLTKYIMIGVVGFLLLQLPLLVFDFRHDFVNAQNLKEFVISKEEHIRPLSRGLSTVKEIQGRSFKIFSQQLGSKTLIGNQLILLLVIVGFTGVVIEKRKRNRVGLAILTSWIGVTIIGTSFYTSSVFDHYLGFIYPAPFIVLGVIFSRAWQNPIGKVITTLFISTVTIVNLKTTPAFGQKIRTVSELNSIAQQIVNLSFENKRYNLVLLSDTKDYKGMNIRYFLETTNHPPASPEDYTGLDELYIITEPPFTDPLASEIYEIRQPELTKIQTVIAKPDGLAIYKVIK